MIRGEQFKTMRKNSMKDRRRITEEIKIKHDPVLILMGFCISGYLYPSKVWEKSLIFNNDDDLNQNMLYLIRYGAI